MLLFGSKYLLGRVKDLVGAEALVHPVSSKTSGPLQAAVISENADNHIVRFLAKPLGDGSFVANVPQAHGLVLIYLRFEVLRVGCQHVMIECWLA